MPEFSPHDLRHRRVSVLHLQGMPWARIGEHVGQRDLKTTADTYTHVLIDETEVDYTRLLTAGERGLESSASRPADRANSRDLIAGACACRSLDGATPTGSLTSSDVRRKLA